MTAIKSAAVCILLSALVFMLASLTPAGVPRAGEWLGSYSVSSVVPGGAWTYAHPEVMSSENWYVRVVKVNDVRLTEDLDYTVVDDGSNKGVVIFSTRPIRGDHLEISGPTLEQGTHSGTILFL